MYIPGVLLSHNDIDWVYRRGAEGPFSIFNISQRALDVLFIALCAILRDSIRQSHWNACIYSHILPARRRLNSMCCERRRLPDILKDVVFYRRTFVPLRSLSNRQTKIFRDESGDAGDLLLYTAGLDGSGVYGIKI